MQRVILHCDMNNFFASVECAKNPSLRGKPVAVCGSVEERHGIVLAKNEEAKRYGITTGEPVVKATAKCPHLTIVPPHYEEYLHYSEMARRIYYDYTDLVEPYGADECWLDVTGSRALFGNGREIADILRERIRRELGLTISVGVSFNKIFAKLGSDMKKPDAVTEIPYESFREKIWHLPVGELFGVGPASESVLRSYGITTIGQLAKAHPPMIRSRLGKNGLRLIEDANGRNHDPVLSLDIELPVKSVGHGTTTRRDMTSEEEVKHVMLSLCEEIGHRLLALGKRACGVSIALRDNALHTRQYQCKLPLPTDSYSLIAAEAAALMKRKHRFERPLRSVSVTAIDLIAGSLPSQLDFFSNVALTERHETIDRLMDSINGRYGKGSIRYGVLFADPMTDVGRGFGFGRREELRH